MSVFIFGSQKEQIKYCFSVYDLTGKGIIAKEDLATLLQKCLRLQGQEEDGEDGVKVVEDCSFSFVLLNSLQDIIDLTLKKMDLDKDGRICFEDFEETVKSEPLLLEAFGACLPGSRHLDNFLKDVLDRPEGVQQIKNFYLGPGLSV